jgi:hypothetical protein
MTNITDPNMRPTVSNVVVKQLSDTEKLKLVRQALESFNDRIARRYKGSEFDAQVAYGMEIVVDDLIAILNKC